MATPSFRGMWTLIAMLGGILAVASPGGAADVHLIIACDTSPEAGLGQDVIADGKSIEDLFKSQVPRVLREFVLPSPFNAKDILGAVSRIQAGPEDAIVFYYSGHGKFDDRVGQILVAGGTELALVDLQTALSERMPRAAIILTDCCNGRPPKSPPPPREEGRRPFPIQEDRVTPLMNSLLFRTAGLVSITSSKPGELSLTRGDGLGSLFTYPLVRYLEKKKSESLSWDRVVVDVQRQVDADFKRAAPDGIDRNRDGTKDQFTQTPYTYVPPLRFGVKIDQATMEIVYVVPLSPAARVRTLPDNRPAALDAGDRILEINGKRINSKADFEREVEESGPQMRLKVRAREGNEFEVEAKLNP